MAIIGFILVAMLPDRVAAAKYTYDYTPICAQAYSAYLALQPTKGDSLIRRELQLHPDNLMATYIEDYGDFLTLVFNGDPKQRTSRSDHESERIDKLEEGSDEEPWKRVTLAGINLHWAIIHIRFGDRLKAAFAFRRSYVLLKENAKKFPTFAPTAVMYGIEEAMAGTIPDGYKWLLSVFGMKGDLNSGLNRLSGYLKTNISDQSPLHEEALIYDFYTRFFLGSGKAAVWQQAGSDASFDIRRSLLRAFIRANLALSYHKADAAIAAMETAKAMPGVDAYPVFDYELGSALLMRLNGNCTTYLERFATNNTGKLFTKDALYKAAVAWYLKGDMKKANAARASILTKGNLITDADNGAERFAKNGRWPNTLLFKSRVLVEGGYAGQALALLQATSAAAFPDIADKLEYDFRLGRALEETGDAAKAVQCYQRVINAGSERPEDFAARSALQMAMIYEVRNQIAEAKRYFTRCLSMRNHDFQNSIDQQAKAGLGRLNKGAGS